jgi:hypothetical protein
MAYCTRVSFLVFSHGALSARRVCVLGMTQTYIVFVVRFAIVYMYTR